MRTYTDVISYPRYANHWLDEGESWSDFGMDQPNPFFAHLVDWPYCPICREGR